MLKCMTPAFCPLSRDLAAVRDTANYTCWVRNAVGVDSLTHQLVAVTTPPPPTLALAHANHDALNLTITPAGDGGAPILGESPLPWSYHMIPCHYSSLFLLPLMWSVRYLNPWPTERLL